MENQVKGVYISRKPYNEFCDKLLAWAKSIGVPNLYTADQLHLTVLYSRENIQHSLDTESVWAEPIGISVLNTSLVLFVYENRLFERFFDLLSEGGTHDFPDYLPHITLAELPKDFDASSLIGLKPDFDIDLTEETLEDLDLDWKATNNITSSEGSKLIFDRTCVDVISAFLKDLYNLSPKMENAYTMSLCRAVELSSVIDIAGVKYYTERSGNNYSISMFPFPIYVHI